MQDCLRKSNTNKTNIGCKNVDVEVDYKRLIIVFVFMFWSAQTYADNLNLYECPTNSLDYVSCSKACVHDKSVGLSSRFIVNVDKGIVMNTTSVNGVEISSSIYKNCTVIDDKNFVCNYKDMGVAKASGKLTMSNGKVYMEFSSLFDESTKRHCYK